MLCCVCSPPCVGWHGRGEDVCHQLVSVPDLLESSQKVAGLPSDGIWQWDFPSLTEGDTESHKRATAHKKPKQHADPGLLIPAQLSLY